MKAEDTAMSDEDLMDIAWRIYPDKTNTPFITQERRAVAKAQAEISYKAGIKEVVDWINENNSIMVVKDDGATMFLYVGNEWQAKLKEWGITP